MWDFNTGKILVKPPKFYKNLRGGRERVEVGGLGGRGRGLWRVLDELRCELTTSVVSCVNNWNLGPINSYATINDGVNRTKWDELFIKLRQKEPWKITVLLCASRDMIRYSSLLIHQFTYWIFTPLMIFINLPVMPAFTERIFFRGKWICFLQLNEKYLA